MKTVLAAAPVSQGGHFRETVARHPGSATAAEAA
jgi:hypothetical protein